MDDGNVKDFVFLEYVDKVVELHDKIFRNVATTKRYNDNTPEKCAMDIHKLTDIQCQEVKNLCGLLVKLKETTDCYRSRTAEYLALEAVPNPWLKYQQEPSLTEESLRKTIALQRDLLVQELCRGEELEKTLKAREELVVSITAELHQTQRKLLQQQKQALTEEEREAMNSSVNEATKTQLEDNPESLVGKYVRKQFDSGKFFGVIARFRNPYFTVIYEDADYEDITKKELMVILWNNFVPETKTKACTKHMKEILEDLQDEGDESEDDKPEEMSEVPSSDSLAEPNTNTSSLATSSNTSSSVVTSVSVDNLDTLPQQLLEQHISPARVLKPSPTRVTPPSPLITNELNEQSTESNETSSSSSISSTTRNRTPNTIPTSIIPVIPPTRIKLFGKESRSSEEKRKETESVHSLVPVKFKDNSTSKGTLINGVNKIIEDMTTSPSVTSVSIKDEVQKSGIKLFGESGSLKRKVEALGSSESTSSNSNKKSSGTSSIKKVFPSISKAEWKSPTKKVMKAVMSPGTKADPIDLC